MVDSPLLKMARARDDDTFVLRFSAALSVRAHQLEEASFAGLTPAGRAFAEWVLDNPLEPPHRFLAFVATNAGLAAKMTLIEDRIQTDGITDEELIQVITLRWSRISNFALRHGITTLSAP